MSVTKEEPSAKKPVLWRKTAVEGLYEYVPKGTYYSRTRVNGKRVVVCLNTTVFTTAKILHAKGNVERALQRQRREPATTEPTTLADLAAEIERRIAANRSEPVTKATQGFSLARIRKHWPTDPAKTSIRKVRAGDIIAFRDALLKAERPRGGSKTLGNGYKPAVVNQTLSLLRMMLEIAVEKHVIPKNPFDDATTLQQDLYLPAQTRKPQLPTRADMDRLFAEMLVIPNEVELPKCSLSWLRIRARDCQEHARLMAYSGMRVSEANALRLEDDLGDQLHVRGPQKADTGKGFNTKTASSDRRIPIHPALRALLDTIKARGKVGTFANVETSLGAIERACKRLGIPKLTHHDLRHYFATICIEEGVDIPTVSRWLGHSDGGAFAMKIYGHLRQEHSIAAMQKVSFAPRSRTSPKIDE